jgi:2-keto-3-deoxy-6-phosphogluconate aldolase
MAFEELFGEHRVMAILRGQPAAQTAALANAAWDAGVELVAQRARLGELLLGRFDAD